MKRRRTLLRRNFLRGAGATTLALPLLPSLHAGAQAGAYPKRCVVWWVPEGMAQSGKPQGATDLPGPLDGLSKHRNNVCVLRGINNDASRDYLRFDHHESGPRTMLNGGFGPSRQIAGVEIARGQTIDRVIGSIVGRNSPYETYEIGVQSDKWFPYKSQISFNREGAPRNATPNPSKAFDDLLGSVAPASPSAGPARPPQRLQTRRSVLDSVHRELASLRCTLDAEGRYKLDAHAESVRTIERQTEALLSGNASGGSAVVPAVSVPGNFGSDSVYGENDNVPAVGELQMRIAASALAAGSTQVITFHWGHTGSFRRYTWIPGLNYPNMQHHDLSHSCCQGPRSRDGYDDLVPIFRWYFQQLSFFLDLLDSIPEGDGTLLDHTLVLYCSEFGNTDHGRNGGHRDVPFLLAGMGDTFRLGQNFHVGGRTQNDLYLAILHGFGIDLPEFGESRYNRGPLNEVLR